MNTTNDKEYYIWSDDSEPKEDIVNRPMPEDIQQEIHCVAVASNIPPRLFENAVIHEASAISSTGARSLTHLMPARLIGVLSDDNKTDIPTSKRIKNLIINAIVGAVYGLLCGALLAAAIGLILFVFDLLFQIIGSVRLPIEIRLFYVENWFYLLPIAAAFFSFYAVYCRWNDDLNTLDDLTY